MPNTDDESKEKIWCSAFSNCFSRGTPSKTWLASTTDAVIGLGCKFLTGSLAAKHRKLCAVFGSLSTQQS